ncbi:dirigent protein 11 [Tanacetum coccineum]
MPNTHAVAPQDAGALIFHRVLTEGPKNTSRVIGKAQGFIIPAEQFARSGFNIIYLTFDTHEYSGSVSIQAKNLGNGRKDELTVVGGTGSFAFVRGVAVLTQRDDRDTDLVVPYHIRLHLKYPNRSKALSVVGVVFLNDMIAFDGVLFLNDMITYVDIHVGLLRLLLLRVVFTCDANWIQLMDAERVVVFGVIN